MIPTMPQDSRDGLSEQWRAMMLKEEGDGYEHGVAKVGDFAEERRFRQYHQEPEGDRSHDASAQYRDERDNYRNKNRGSVQPNPRYHTQSQQEAEQFQRYYQQQEQHYYELQRRQQQYYHQQRQQEQKQHQIPTRNDEHHLNAKNMNRNNDTDFIDGIIESLSELSNNQDTKSKSVLEQTKKGWSIHESKRRTQERESRRAATKVSNRNQHRSKNQHSNRETAQREPYYDDGGTHYDFSQERESPPSTSDFNTAYSDESRHHQSQSVTFNSVPSTTAFQRNRILSADKSLLDKQVPAEIPISPGRKGEAFVQMSSNKNMNSEEHLVQSRRTSRKVIQGTSPESISYGQDKYAAKSPKPYKQKSILKDQQAPSPYLSPSNGVLRTFMPNNCGPMNSKDPLETVVNLFDAPIRLAANQKALRNSIGGCQQHDRSNDQRTPSNGNPEEYSSVPPSAINSYIQDIASQNDNKNIIPKTEAQKRHEMEMLRGVYHDSRQGNNVGHSKRMSLDVPSNYKASIKPALAQSGSIDISVHDAIWGSDSAESPSRKMNVLPTRGPRHSTGGINTKTMSASSPNFATDFGSLAKSVMSRQESVGSGIKDDFMSQLSRCNGTGQESPPRLSNLFRNGDAKKDENATPSSALSMFEEIQRQIIGKTNVDSSGFPTSENTDPNRRAEQDQRLKEKLDAVRARSVRNAEIFEKMESEKKNPMPKKEEQQQASFASFGDTFGDPVATSEGHPSAEKTTAGKNLDPFLDKITEAAWSNNNHIVCNDESKSRFACSPRVASEATGRTCRSRVTPETSEEELGHYMYVAYSQFGEDARRVLKLCGHHSLPTPDRRNGEILIKVQASTVSSSDCAIRRGEWSNVMMDPYIIPGTAMVGRVMDMDRKKSRTSFSSSSIEPGDIVLSLSTSGGNARYTCLPKSNLVKLPPQIKPERAVCLAETYLTAFQALHLGQKGALRYRENSLKGKSILIMGGYSPLGKAIIELSRAGGAAFCYALVNGDDLRQQCDSLEQWGAMPLSNNPQDWLTLIGRQIDIFLTTYDPNQQEEGTHKISADHWKALKKDGQVHVVCSHPGMNEVEQREKIFASSKKEKDSKGFRIPSCRPGGREKLADRAIYYNLFDAWESDRGTKTIAKKDMEHLIQLLEVELVDPEIRESFPLAKLAKAQRSLEHKKVTGAGHLVCSPWLGDKAIGEGTPKTDKAARGTQY